MSLKRKGSGSIRVTAAKLRPRATYPPNVELTAEEREAVQSLCMSENAVNFGDAANAK
jgi:hypothetical protein